MAVWFFWLGILASLEHQLALRILDYGKLGFFRLLFGVIPGGFGERLFPGRFFRLSKRYSLIER